MALNITNSDITLCKFRTKYIYMRFLLLDSEMHTLDELQGVCISGTVNLDVTSDIRRTCSIEMYPKDSSYDVAEYNRIWLNRKIKIQLGFARSPSSAVTWYDMGIFVFDSCNYSYTADGKTLSIECSDLINTINGTHGGIQDGESFKIEEGNDLKKVVEDLLDNHSDIKEHNIQTIGVYGCLQNKSIDWKQNRIDSGSSPEVVELEERDGVDYLYDSPYLDGYELYAASSGEKITSVTSGLKVVSDVEVSKYVDTGTWHTVPYDLEFDAGTSLYEFITTIRDLYSGYESFFDTDGQFVLQMIPTCENDPVTLEYYDLCPLVISESIDIDFTTIKNATQIYGKSIETDRYATDDAVKYWGYDESLGGYVVEINLEKHFVNDNSTLGFIMPSIPELSDEQKAKPLFLKVYAYTSSVLATGEISSVTTTKTIPCKNRITVVEDKADTDKTKDRYTPLPLSNFEPGESYCFKYVKNQDCYQYVGMYQIQAYSEDRIPDSPFSIDKIGMRMQVLSGGEYEDITDMELCQQRADYENWLAGRFNDTISLESIVIPFLTGNEKVTYKSKMNGQLNTYLVKSISFNLSDSATCQITLNKYYDLYPDIIAPAYKP